MVESEEILVDRQEISRLLRQRISGKFPFKVADRYILIHISDLPILTQDFSCLFSYEGIFFAAREIKTYQDMEEFRWKVILN